jgi:hypothetical protein
MSRYWTPKVYESISKSPEAQRELDQEVAEKVLGWKRWEHPDKILYIVAPTEKRDRYGIPCHWKQAHPETPPFCDTRRWVPFFSTRIEDAWQVVEYLGPDREGVQFQLNHLHDGRWLASFGVMEPAGDGIGATAPEAICRAALAYVGACEKMLEGAPQP